MAEYVINNPFVLLFVLRSSKLEMYSVILLVVTSDSKVYLLPCG